MGRVIGDVPRLVIHPRENVHLLTTLAVEVLHAAERSLAAEGRGGAVLRSVPRMSAPHAGQVATAW